MEELLAHAALGQRRLLLHDVPLHRGRTRHDGRVRNPDGQEVRRPEEVQQNPVAIDRDLFS